MNVKKHLQSIENGEKNNFIHIQHLMKMETPNKHPVQGMSNTLKRALNDNNYLRAMEKIITAYKNAIKNGLY